MSYTCLCLQASRAVSWACIQCIFAFRELQSFARMKSWACIWIGWRAFRAVLVSSYVFMYWGLLRVSACVCIRRRLSTHWASMHRAGHVIYLLVSELYVSAYNATILAHGELSVCLDLLACIKKMNMSCVFWLLLRAEHLSGCLCVESLACGCMCLQILRAYIFIM